MKKSIVIGILWFCAVTVQAQQGGETAVAFLERLSENYASMKDFTAYLTVRRAGRTDSGTLKYKSPDNLRIDFTSPQDQVLVISSDLLQFYIPRFDMIMEQRLRSGDAETAGGIVSGNGLKLLLENYNTSYVDKPGLQPLQNGSNQMVYKLKLEWRNFTEGFRTLELSVDQNMRIVRIVGVTSLFETIQFDYTGIRVNQNIPGSTFVLELENTSKVNIYPDFLRPIE